MGDHVVLIVKAWYKLTWGSIHRHLVVILRYLFQGVRDLSIYVHNFAKCVHRKGWPPFMQWHRFWITPSYIEYIALANTVLFNAGNPSAVSRSWQMKAALPIFPHYKVPLTFRYSWKRLRNRRWKNLKKFSQMYIAFVLQHVQCFEKTNTYWLNELWKTRLPKRLKCTIERF